MEINAEIDFLPLTTNDHIKKKLLLRQLPKQDILRDSCNFLNSQAARKRFQNFTKNRNGNALNIAVRSIRNEVDEVSNMVKF